MIINNYVVYNIFNDLYKRKISYFLDNKRLIYWQKMNLFMWPLCTTEKLYLVQLEGYHKDAYIEDAYIEIKASIPISNCWHILNLFYMPTCPISYLDA